MVYLEKLCSPFFNILDHQLACQYVNTYIEVAESGNKALATNSIPKLLTTEASGSSQQKEKA